MIKQVEYNRDLILKMGHDNPVIYNFLTAHHGGYFSYEEMLIGIIFYMNIHNQELVKLNIEKVEREVPELVFYK